MDFWKSLAGLVEAELTSADLPGSLAAISNADIVVFRLQPADDLTARLTIRRKDLVRVSELAEKRGETLRILSHRGLYWHLSGMLKRPVLLVGLLVFLALARFLPTRIFFVRVEGNSAVPEKRILEAAEESGICFGASRREVRSERVKNALLQAVPQLQWAGVNTAGCVATVSVRERPEEEKTRQETGISSIVAVRDGVILSLTATSGNPVCQVGSAVKEGQVLISGYTDCGICIQATRAEGEIFAQTSRKVLAVTVSEDCRIEERTLAGRKISLLLGKKRINLWKDSGISEGSCGRMYEEYYITLPGGFALPVAVCIERLYAYGIAASQQDAADAEGKLAAFSDRYLSGQMIAGQITGADRTFTADAGLCRMESTYICTEMIGRHKQEQIGDTNGENS